jgi:osmotically-inducible protein OsmY
MKTYVWLAPLVLSASVALAGCQDSNAPGTNNAPGASAPSAEQRGGETKLSNSDLEKAIQTKLESDNQLKEANLSVNADASENKATIKGQVVSQDLRTKAVELAKSAQPGLTINDEIEVKPAG